MSFDTEPDAEDMQSLIDLGDQSPQRTRKFIGELIDKSGIEFPAEVDPSVAADLLSGFVDTTSKLGVFQGAYLGFQTDNDPAQSRFHLLYLISKFPGTFQE